MLAVLDGIRDLTWFSMVIRMMLAVFCGGIIGIEREFRRRPAGFRTHILICMGAAMTTLTSQYLGLTRQYTVDLARLGAQVIAGIGFIGAGTIIVTGNQRVKGLTTAAGLWTAAIIGLAIGAGFYEGALMVTALVLGAEILLIKLEYRILNNTPEVNLYMEYSERESLSGVLKYCMDRGIKVLDLQITGAEENENRNRSAIFSLRLNKDYTMSRLSGELLALDGVALIEEL